MPVGNVTRNSSRDAVAREASLSAHRQYNRNYMRRWRADPSHRERENANRCRWQCERKEHVVEEPRHPFTNWRGEKVCGFCKKRPPKSEILRLESSVTARSRYVEVLIPYCGEC
jgi:hypothetical protein